MIDEEIVALIHRRRRQVWVHSIIYYRMNDNIISDYQWSEWAQELEDLQMLYPEEAKAAPFADIFEDFDHSTGSTLPLDDEHMIGISEWLLRIRDKK